MFRCVFFILTLTARIYAENSTVEDYVLVLNDSNFDNALKENEFLLVEFYAPWCAHCKAVAPEFSAAAKILEDEGSPVKLAKVDATVELKLADRFVVRGYPTFTFFIKGEQSDYTGNHHTADFIRWLNKRTGPPAVELKDTSSVTAFRNESDVVVIGFFKDPTSDGAKEFLKVATILDYPPLGITSNRDVFSEYKIKKDSIIVFKQHDDERIEFKDEVTEKNIQAFVIRNQLPLVSEFNKDTVPKIFSSGINSHILLIAKNEEKDNALKEFREVAKEFREELIFIYLDPEASDNVYVLDFFGLKKDTAPAVRIIRVSEDTKKYQPTTKGIDAAAVRKFAKEYLGGKLQPFLLTEDVPKDWDSNPVKILVGKNFKDVAFDQKKAVFVLFYAPWCGHCKQIAPIWNELGEAYKDNDTIVIAKIDATTNEIENITITSYPKFKFFPSGTDLIIDYTGERTLEAFKTFLDSYGKDDGSAQQEEKEEQAEVKEEKTEEDKSKGEKPEKEKSEEKTSEEEKTEKEKSEEEKPEEGKSEEDTLEKEKAEKERDEL